MGTEVIGMVRRLLVCKDQSIQFMTLISKHNLLHFGVVCCEVASKCDAKTKMRKDAWASVIRKEYKMK